MNFIEDQKLIRFDEKNHKYYLDDKQLISCTQFISKFSDGFDKDGSILTRCALKEGVSEAILQKRWNDKGKKAGEIGSDIHAQIELFIKTGKIKRSKWTPLVKEFARFNFKGQLFSEVILFDDSLYISGTSDFVQIIDNKIIQVHDLKTNEKQPTDYSFGRKMKYPIEHLNDSKLMHYFLQISLYLYILSSKYNYEIGDNNFIFWANRKKNAITKIPVELKIQEIMDMIAHYTYQKSLEENSLV